jgi:hypothetical protein
VLKLCIFKSANGVLRQMNGGYFRPSQKQKPTVYLAKFIATTLRFLIFLYFYNLSK